MAIRIALAAFALLLVVLPCRLLADEPMSATAGAATIHKVQEGETLWTIAEKYYGDGKLWPKIWDANKDKVSNAQSLKAGDELVIPPKEGEAPAPEAAPAESAPAAGEQVSPEQPPVPEAPAAAEPAAPAPAAEATGEEAPAAVTSETEATRPLADDVDLYCSFFVSDGIDESIRLVASEHQDSKFGFDVDDLVFINKGTVDGIENGTEYMALRSDGKMVHPASHNNLGTLYAMLGRATVVCTFEKASMVRITQACFPMELGTIMIPFKEAPAPIGKFKPTERCDPATGKNAGWIVHSQDDIIGLAEGHNVLIDLGSRDGVVPGDIFTIYREDLSRGRLLQASSGAGLQYSPGAVEGLPRWVLGDLVVVMTQEKTSTARIVSTNGDIAIGDRVELQ